MLRHLVFILALCLPLSVFAGLAGEVTHLSGTLSVKHQDGTTGLLAVKSPVLVISRPYGAIWIAG